MKRLLLSLIALSAVEGQAADMVGPLRIQDMSPVSLVRLDMLPPPAESDSRWRIELTNSQANVYTMDENARAYLSSRGVTRQFGGADAQAMLERRTASTSRRASFVPARPESSTRRSTASRP